MGVWTREGPGWSPWSVLSSQGLLRWAHGWRQPGHCSPLWGDPRDYGCECDTVVRGAGDGGPGTLGWELLQPRSHHAPGAGVIGAALSPSGWGHQCGGWRMPLLPPNPTMGWVWCREHAEPLRGLRSTSPHLLLFLPASVIPLPPPPSPSLSPPAPLSTGALWEDPTQPSSGSQRTAAVVGGRGSGTQQVPPAPQHHEGAAPGSSRKTPRWAGGGATTCCVLAGECPRIPCSLGPALAELAAQDEASQRPI